MRIVVTIGAVLIAAAITMPAYADDTTSCLDAVGKGQKLRDGHKLVEAREQFRICAAPSCPVVVQRDCLGWVNETDASIPTIVLSAKDASGEDALDVRVTIDGSTLPTKLDGAALPIDPGPHTFRFVWPDGTSIEREALVKEGEKAMVVSVRQAAPPASALPGPIARSEPGSSHGGGVGLAGYVVGGTGLAAVVVGSIFGGLTFSEVSQAKSACGAAGCAATTSPTAVHDMQTARTYGNASTGLIIGGGALVGAGVVMVLVGGKKAEGSALALVPTWTARSASVGLQGSF